MKFGWYPSRCIKHMCIQNIALFSKYKWCHIILTVQLALSIQHYVLKSYGQQYIDVYLIFFHCCNYIPWWIIQIDRRWIKWGTQALTSKSKSGEGEIWEASLEEAGLVIGLRWGGGSRVQDDDSEWGFWSVVGMRDNLDTLLPLAQHLLHNILLLLLLLSKIRWNKI